MVVDSSGEDIKLANHRCKPAVLAFYPADGGPVCGDQVVLYYEVLTMFEEYNAGGNFGIWAMEQPCLCG
jgi:peroxiredoxin